MTNLDIARRAAARHWPAETATYRRIMSGDWDTLESVTTAVAALEMRDSMAAELAGALRTARAHLVRIADRDFDCSVLQHGMAAAEHARNGLSEINATLAKWEAGK